MKEQLKKQDMVVGKQYKGYAWRNEYGEFFFRPSAVGLYPKYHQRTGIDTYQITKGQGWCNGLYQGPHGSSKQTNSSIFQV